MKTVSVIATAICLVATSGHAQPAPDRAAAISMHRAAAKKAAGTDFDGTLATTCVAPDGFVASPHRAIPPRSEWYAKPQKVFDNLYWVGTKVHSSWALKTSGGIILIDTLYNYAVEAEIVDGLKSLGLNPASVKYVIVSHGHGDHDEGARLMQARYGSRIVMGGPDWDAVEKMTEKPGGIPKRDIVAQDGQKIVLGDTSVTLVATPGHSPGTFSMIFQVRDHGRPLTVAYSGGTAFNFPHDQAHYDIYINSQRKFAKAAADAGATILMSNHTQFDKAYDRVRIAQLPRAPGEPHPYEIGSGPIARYFVMTEECARAGQLEAGGS